MTARLIIAALSQTEGLEAKLQLALVRLAAAADKRGCYGQGQEPLAQAMGIGERSLTDALRALEDLGLISRQVRHRRSGKRRADLITLTLDNPQNLRVAKPGQSAKSAGEQSAGFAGGQSAKSAGPVDSYSTNGDAAQNETSQGDGLNRAANDPRPLVLIPGGRAA